MVFVSFIVTSLKKKKKGGEEGVLLLSHLFSTVRKGEGFLPSHPVSTVIFRGLIALRRNSDALHIWKSHIYLDICWALTKISNLAQLLLKKYSTVESSMVEGRHFSGPSPYLLNEEAALLYLSMIIIKGVEQ